MIDTHTIDNHRIEFIDEDGTFRLQNPDAFSGLYFPVAGKYLKSAVTPFFGGDAKLDQNHFLMEPVSVENLHNNRSARAFWCRTEDAVWCATAEGESSLEAGLMWQKVRRENAEIGLSSETTIFIPQDFKGSFDSEMEVLITRITNISGQTIIFRPTALFPLYGRSAANIRDHRDVTAMLNRAVTIPEGIVLRPTLSFDERGHLPNTVTYFVCGYAFGEKDDSQGKLPEDFYPSQSGYIGEGGSFTSPRSVEEDWKGLPAGVRVDGQEVTGGLHFAKVSLEPEESISFVILSGAIEDAPESGKTESPENGKGHPGISRSIPWYDDAPDTEQVHALTSRFAEKGQAEKSLEETKDYWQKQVNVKYHTGSADFDNYMRWVSFQPILRRIYGCSFLPHHDYGKGGRGWRDLWQDCLALLLMDPAGVREMILSNFDGVRMDGTNATIIGEKQGEFLADRNAITRVWMDHGYWPLGTVKLYIDQTGDLAVLSEKAGYFKDRQVKRALAVDEKWTPQDGTRQKDAEGNVYRGTVLEHLLLQNLCACLETGEHQVLRLRDADWNDALDMAGERGESVAFTGAYAGNLLELADLIDRYAETFGTDTILLAEEMQILLGDASTKDEAQKILDSYLTAVAAGVSGRTASVSATLVTKVLRDRAKKLINLLRSQEWVTDGNGHGWFNSYYDNHGRQVEGEKDGHVRMMLTGQVFAVMSGTADDVQTKEIVRSADRYLYDRNAGGYRLNTNFHEIKTDLGRMFGFAYGEKENGAVFSHMTVMYANALYKRGFVRDGYKALQTLADTAMNFKTSRIYPGIPEYFSSNEILSAAAPQSMEHQACTPGLSRMGRGRYHYLTGAASWYMLTMISQVFGVRGQMGDLLFAPRLVEEQFDAAGTASVSCLFADRNICVVYHNPEKLEAGTYRVTGIRMNEQHVPDEDLSVMEDGSLLLKRSYIQKAALSEDEVLLIDVELGRAD